MTDEQEPTPLKAEQLTFKLSDVNEYLRNGLQGDSKQRRQALDSLWQADADGRILNDKNTED